MILMNRTAILGGRDYHRQHKNSVKISTILLFNSVRYRPKPKKGKPLERLVTDPEIPVTEDDFQDHVNQMKLHNFKGKFLEYIYIGDRSQITINF